VYCLMEIVDNDDDIEVFEQPDRQPAGDNFSGSPCVVRVLGS